MVGKKNDNNLNETGDHTTYINIVGTRLSRSNNTHLCPMTSGYVDRLIRPLFRDSGNKGGVTVDVFLAKDRITPELYDTSFTNDEFTRLFNSAYIEMDVKGIQKTVHKAYFHKDLVYDNYCNNEVRSYRLRVRDVDTREVPALCVGLVYDRERIPVSSFPCSASLENVAYIKTYIMKLHSRTSIVFESKLDDSRKIVNQVFVQGQFGSKSDHFELKKTSDAVERVVGKLVSLREYVIACSSSFQENDESNIPPAQRVNDSESDGKEDSKRNRNTNIQRRTDITSRSGSRVAKTGTPSSGSTSNCGVIIDLIQTRNNTGELRRRTNIL